MDGWELSVLYEGWMYENEVSRVKGDWMENMYLVLIEVGWEQSGLCEGRMGGN